LASEALLVIGAAEVEGMGGLDSALEAALVVVELGCGATGGGRPPNNESLAIRGLSVCLPLRTQSVRLLGNTLLRESN
jgi:hypothetical protein